MSKIEVDQVDPQSGSTLTLGTSGDTITIPSGVTIANNGTQTGFGRTGTVNWQSSIKTANFTAASGEGYFCNTTSGAFTATLPASPSAGDIVAFKDYANTFDTNALAIGRNSSPIGGDSSDKQLGTEGVSATLVYIDSTKGWLVVNDGVQSTVAEPTYNIESLVIAGGGGGASAGNGGGNHCYGGGGGGAGGYRTSTQGMAAGVTLSVVIGAAGSGGTEGGGTPAGTGTEGGNTSISGTGFTTIESAGGGKGGTETVNGTNGGSGGGGGGLNGGTGGTGGTANYRGTNMITFYTHLFQASVIGD